MEAEGRGARERASLERALAKLTSPERVSTKAPVIEPYGRDLWTRELLAEQAGRAPEHRPDAVVWPKSTDEVQALVRFAAAEGIPIVPFGAGSGVCMS